MPELQESELEQVKSLNLETLPSMPLADRAAFPNERVVYFAVTGDGTVLYVGQTSSLSRRWLAHGKEWELVNAGCSRVAWLRSEGDLRTLETAFVKRFRPPLNAGRRFPKESAGMRIGTVIKQYRIADDLTLRDVGRDIGIGAATLMRLEQGRDPDGATLTKVLMWLLRAEQTNGARKERVGR